MSNNLPFLRDDSPRSIFARNAKAVVPCVILHTTPRRANQMRVVPLFCVFIYLIMYFKLKFDDEEVPLITVPGIGRGT